MKRDMDLVRLMLLKVEEHPHGFAPDDLALDGYTQEQIGYHAKLLGEAGLVDATDVTCMGDPSPAAIIVSLTWQGYEFLESARDVRVWDEAKARLAKVGSVSLPVLQALLTRIIEASLGL